MALFLDRNVEILKLVVVKGFLYTFFGLLRLLLYQGQPLHLLAVLAILLLGNHLALLLRRPTATRLQVVHFYLVSCVALSDVELVFNLPLKGCILLIGKQISIYLGNMLTIFAPPLSLHQSFEGSFLRQALFDWIVVMRHVKILLVYL